MADYDVIVIGAGVIGVMTAEALSHAGLRICVVEQNAEPAAGTSHANGGLVTPSMAEPWAAPGLPKKILGWIGKEDAPFLLRLKALPSLWSWGRAFVKNCTQAKWESNTRNMITLSMFSRDQLLKVAQRHDLANVIQTCGSLRVFRDQAAANAAQSMLDFMRDNGVICEPMDANACAEHEPAIKHLKDDIYAASFYPEDVVGDCAEMTRGVARSLQSRHSVRFEFNTAVKALTQEITNQGTEWTVEREHEESISASNIVIATAQPIGGLLTEQDCANLLCAPVKGYSVTMTCPVQQYALRVPVIDDANKIGVVPLGGNVRVVGTAEFCGADLSLSGARIDNLIGAAKPVPPKLEESTVLQKWAGLRSMSPDGLPYIGALGQTGLYANIGHGHLGWTNACGSAALISEIITRQPPTINPAPYLPRRY